MTPVYLPPFNPHPGQLRIMAQRRKRNVICCGRRFGKTALAVDIALNRTGGALVGPSGTGRKGANVAWYAPNDSYFTNVFTEIVDQYSPLIKKAPSSPRPQVIFKNGGRLDFWTLENPMRCGRGNHYARVIIDEGAHARHLKDAWEKTIEFTLADLDGDMWAFSTPFGLNYFADLYRRAETDQDWSSYHAPSTDNPYLPAGWMESKRATMPERVYRQEVLAEFLQDGAGVFRRVDSMPVCYWQDGGRGAFVIGVDWGRSNDYTVLVVMSNRGEIVHVDRFTGIGYDLQVGRLLNLWNAFNRCPIIAESNSIGGPLIERLQSERVNVRPFLTTAASKNEAVESLSLAIESGQVSCPQDPRVEPLKAELVAFDQTRLPSGAMRYSAPPGMHDDCVMALAIAWSGVQTSHVRPIAGHRVRGL